MKKVDSGEFYSAKQDNVFSEYKPYRAEEYYSAEFSRTPKEINRYNESFNNEGVQSTKSESSESLDANDIRRQYDNLSRTDSAETTDTTASTSGSGANAPTSGANVSQTANTALSGATATAGGATAGATAVAAVVIVSAAVTGGFVADFNSYIENFTGADYVAITVDMDEILSQADKSYGLSADNFSIELSDGSATRKIALVGGKHSYLLTGLQPDKTYTYNFVCNNPSLGSNSNCCSQTFTTLSVGEPECVLDELNNYVVYDEVSQSASVFYSVYLSDYERKYAESTLYLCSSEQTDLSDIKHTVYSDDALDGNNFFMGEVDGVTCDELYLYVVGERETEYGAEPVELFSYKFNIELPEEWQTAKSPAFEVDESSEVLSCLPDRLSVSGSISDFNDSYTYFAYIGQYGEGGTALSEREEVALSIDRNNMTFSLESGAYYGVKNYKYVICARDGEGNEATVYDSGLKPFTASQDYGASYIKVEPADAVYDYTAEKITVTVDPEFTSEYSNYSYKLEVTNSRGEVYGEYTGTGVAVIEITDFTGLDNINLKYYDIGEFAGGEVEYAVRYTTAFVEFGYIFLGIGTSVISGQPDKITVCGHLEKINEAFTYSAYVVQYAEDGTALCERQEVPLEIFDTTMGYALECGAYYGVKTFRYVIYTQDNVGNEVTVFDSGERPFVSEQTYQASYTKVEPENATIEYGESGVTITVDPEFTSEYSNYSYKLVITNSLGEVFGEYTGTGAAVIEIEDYVGLDEIIFTYYDLGEFASGERVFASHSTTGITGQAYFTVADSSVEAICLPDGITVNGSIEKFNKNYTYYAYIEQYDNYGVALCESQEAAISIDTENMTYRLECGVCYGVKNYKFVVFTLDEDENQIIVYDGGINAFTASQDYSASYTKVEPENATIEYGESGVTITVDPEFTSEYSNFSYKLVITNSLGDVFGEYTGTGVAVIEIEDYVGLDEINFTYYDLGEFASGEMSFASHTTTGITGQAYFAVDDSSEEEICLPDGITVNGSIEKFNKNYIYYAYIEQYNDYGVALCESQEASLSIDTENMTYCLESGVCYGVKNYKFVVFTLDENENEIIVYDGGINAFTASQDYSASYTKVEPENATIEYGESGVTITVDPEFTSEYGNYSYKLEVTNSLGEVFGEYTGTGAAVIEIADYVGLDEINFTYYDLGEFASGEMLFASHTTTGITGQAYFAVDDSSEEEICLPDGITVNGSIENLNRFYTYYAYIEQYNDDGVALCESQEAAITIDTENMTYCLESGVCYGVKNYKFVVFALDEDENQIIVYDGGIKAFTASQDYSATYTKVEPADAGIEYSESGVTITVDPEFTSEYGNYSYKLEVTNSLGEVYGEYTGTGVAEIEIEDCVGLDEINFTYYDLGEFASGETAFASHSTEGVAFCVPEVRFAEAYGFNGQYFTLSYSCDMIYDYAQASMDIEISDGVNVYVKHVESVSAEGVIVLDNIEGEPGNVTVSGTLSFKDNQSDGETRSVSVNPAEYAMNYSFEVTKVLADVSGYSVEKMLVTLNFDYQLPEGYKIKITDTANSLDKTVELTDEYSFSDLEISADVNLTVQVTDGDGNAWGEPETVAISKSAAGAEYVSPTMSCSNPFEAVVTYNADGTVNIYRQIIPDAYGRDTVSDDERVYYNAYLQGYYLNSDGAVYTEGYDVIGRGKYASIENIPKQNYFLIYYMMFDYNGVSYVMYAEMPSGSVETVYDCASVTAGVSGGQTTLTVSVSASGRIANKIIIDGVEYEYDDYSDESAYGLTLVLDGEVSVGEAIILFTKQGDNYDTYVESGEITMKGSKYDEHTVTVIAEYA
ncbi:MAG: hypothetical protein ACI4MH_06810 [Candidatus Coproplasma sp.]